jgi:cytochrome c oxidase subunit 2
MVVLMTRVFTRAPLLLTLTAIVAGCTLASASRTLAAQSNVVDIVAERFSFQPSQLRIKAGVPVEIRLRSDDTDHGFRILDTEINARIPKRGKGSTTVTFQAPSPGRYIFECSHVCGAGHAFMRGVIIVE